MRNVCRRIIQLHCVISQFYVVQKKLFYRFSVKLLINAAKALKDENEEPATDHRFLKFALQRLKLSSNLTIYS